MKQRKKKIKGLFLVASFAACGCGNVAEAGLKSTVGAAAIGLAAGMAVSFMAPGLIESKVYSEIDKAIDEKNLSENLSKEIKDELKRQIKEKANKEGWFKTIRSLLRIVDNLKKVKEQNFGKKLICMCTVLNREGFDISRITGRFLIGGAKAGAKAIGGFFTNLFMD